MQSCEGNDRDGPGRTDMQRYGPPTWSSPHITPFIYLICLSRTFHLFILCFSQCLANVSRKANDYKWCISLPSECVCPSVCTCRCLHLCLCVRSCKGSEWHACLLMLGGLEPYERMGVGVVRRAGKERHTSAVA